MGRYFPNTKLKLPLIVAECGNNHEGDLETAVKLLEAAAASGASLVKFQAGTAEGFARTPEDIPRYRYYALPIESYKYLIRRAEQLEIGIFFSVWGEAPGFHSLRCHGFLKIGARQFGQFLEYDGPKTFVSIPYGWEGTFPYKQAVPLHCVSEYPATNPHLEAIWSLANILDRPIGYSDHTIGIEACIEAAKLGAIVIEKHFTLAHDFGPLRDHQLSATPEELKTLVQEVIRLYD